MRKPYSRFLRHALMGLIVGILAACTSTKQVTQGPSTAQTPSGGKPPPRSTPDQGPLDLGLDSDLFLAHLRHRAGSEHIGIKDAAKCRECFKAYAAPCVRFCPAAVYEAAEDGVSIRIRPENCVQCRCCTLKCPFDNILWETPQHGVGPDYRNS